MVQDHTRQAGQKEKEKMKHWQKIKHILKHHNLECKMDELANIELYLTSKKDNTVGLFEARTFSQAVGIAFNFITKHQK